MLCSSAFPDASWQAGKGSATAPHQKGKGKSTTKNSQPASQPASSIPKGGKSKGRGKKKGQRKGSAREADAETEGLEHEWGEETGLVERFVPPVPPGAEPTDFLMCVCVYPRCVEPSGEEGQKTCAAHLVETCPMRPSAAYVGGNAPNDSKVSWPIFDTGASHTLLPTSELTKSQIERAKRLYVKLASGIAKATYVDGTLFCKVVDRWLLSVGQLTRILGCRFERGLDGPTLTLEVGKQTVLTDTCVVHNKFSLRDLRTLSSQPPEGRLGIQHGGTRS